MSGMIVFQIKCVRKPTEHSIKFIFRLIYCVCVFFGLATTFDSSVISYFMRQI